MSRRRLLIPIVALIAAAILASLVYADLTPGTKAPTFTLPTLSGKQFNLANSFRAAPKNVVLLDIWATWCPPCKAEIPYLIDLQKKYKGKPVTFVGVAIDEKRSTVEAFAKEKGINYTVALDPMGDRLSSPYKVRGIPATYVIDKKGVVRFAHVGFSGANEAKQIDSEIQKLMAE